MSDKPLWRILADIASGFLAGEAARRELARAGSGPDAIGATASFGLGTFSDPIALEEERRRDAIVAFMRQQLGKGYMLGVEVRAGQEADAERWDCSEAVEHAYALAGMVIPDGAQQQFDACQAVRSPHPGDLGFLWSDKRGMIGHVLVAADHGSVIHAVGGRGVVEDPAAQWEAHPRWRGWRRHPDFARPKEDRA